MRATATVTVLLAVLSNLDQANAFPIEATELELAGNHRSHEFKNIPENMLMRRTPAGPKDGEKKGDKKGMENAAGPSEPGKASKDKNPEPKASSSSRNSNRFSKSLGNKSFSFSKQQSKSFDTEQARPKKMTLKELDNIVASAPTTCAQLNSCTEFISYLNQFLRPRIMLFNEVPKLTSALRKMIDDSRAIIFEPSEAQKKETVIQEKKNGPKLQIDKMEKADVEGAFMAKFPKLVQDFNEWSAQLIALDKQLDDDMTNENESPVPMSVDPAKSLEKVAKDAMKLLQQYSALRLGVRTMVESLQNWRMVEGLETVLSNLDQLSWNIGTCDALMHTKFNVLQLIKEAHGPKPQISNNGISQLPILWLPTTLPPPSGCKSSIERLECQEVAEYYSRVMNWFDTAWAEFPQLVKNLISVLRNKAGTDVKNIKEDINVLSDYADDLGTMKENMYSFVQGGVIRRMNQMKDVRSQVKEGLRIHTTNPTSIVDPFENTNYMNKYYRMNLLLHTDYMFIAIRKVIRTVDGLKTKNTKVKTLLEEDETVRMILARLGQWDELFLPEAAIERTSPPITGIRSQDTLEVTESIFFSKPPVLESDRLWPAQFRGNMENSLNVIRLFKAAIIEEIQAEAIHKAKRLSKKLSS